MTSQPGGFIQLLMIMGLMFVVFYFFLIRPQQKKQKEHQQMINSLQKGDRIVTEGGMHGFVEGIHDDGTILLKVADGVKIQISKTSVVYIKKKSGEADIEKADIEKKEQS